MSNHLGDTNKMVGDTPRMDASAHDDGAIWETGCDIERELNAANIEIEEKRKDVVWLATEKAKSENYVTELENRLRALWDKYDGDRKHYIDRIKRMEDAYAAKDQQLSNLLHICRDNDIEVSSYDLIHGRKP